MTAVLLQPPYLQFFDADGVPLSDGFVYTYQSGTTTPKATYTDSTQTILAPNPIPLDSSGICTVWISGSYKIVVTSADGSYTKTTDPVTSFVGLTTAANAVFQSFSGNGSQTAFTLSTSVGTDKAAILVFVSNPPLANRFSGTGSQTVFTLSQNMGTDPRAILVEVAGTPLLASTDYTLSGTTLTFTSAPASATNNIVVTQASSAPFSVLNPNQFSLTTTTLTLNTAPVTGSNNIMVFSPSSALGAAAVSAANAAQSESNAATSATAAATSATAAATSATNAATSATSAATSATAAQNYAAALSGTSTTSITIGTGSKTFTTQASKQWVVGQQLQIASTATPTNYMHGNVTSYSGTSLVVNVTDTGGSGTIASWTISVAGTQGPTGPTGATNPLPIIAAGGTANAITATYSPPVTLADQTLVALVASAANTTTNPTFAPNGLTAHTITKKGGKALAAGDIPGALAVCLLEYNLANTRWELLNPANTGLFSIHTQIFNSAGSYTYTPTSGMLYCIAEAVGAGGGGGGNGVSGGGGGGGGGAYAKSLLTAATVGVSQSVTVGAAGSAGTAGGGNGGNGTGTSVGTLLIAGGGAGGQGISSGGGNGGTGGGATAGDVQSAGQPGQAGVSSVNINPVGGGSFYGGGGPSGTGGAGGQGQGNGGGGSGASGGSFAGGGGTDGIVYITEYCSV